MFQECHVIVYAKIHKIYREHGWAYLACKRCGSAAKEVPPATGAGYMTKQTWKCKQHNEITAVGMRYACKNSFFGNQLVVSSYSLPLIEYIINT